jgi:flagellar biosynthesis protein FlhF
MRLKSYFADTIEEAISQARREMGPDAMLVNSKRSGTEARHLGIYEVVCAGEKEARAEDGGGARSRSAAVAPPADRLSQDVTELKQQMERLALTLARSGGGMAGIASDPELSRIFAQLTDADLYADLAYEVVGRMTAPFTPEALRTELGSLVNIDSELGCPGCGPGCGPGCSPGSPARIVAVAGPPGAGKTTTLVKLALQHGINARKRSQILTLDTFRIAAADELQSYAAILGIGCEVLETTAALAQALEEHRDKDLILIDTPGLGDGEMDGFEEVAQFLSGYPGMDTHLVLPASMRTSDLRRAAQRYEVFGPRKLLFTRLDETETFGPILSQSVRMGKPISYLSRGQRIPEDLEPATLDVILDMILRAAPAGPSRFGVAAA